MKPTFKKAILFSTLVILIAVGMLFALAYLSKPKRPSQTHPTALGVYDGFQLTMTLEKTKFTFGEPINITFTLTNISNQTVSFDVGKGDCDFVFQVYNATNSTVYSYPSYSPPNNGEMQIPLELFETLNAGQSMSENLSWQQESSSVGTYYIVGQVSHLYNLTSTLETTPIQMTID